MTQHTTDILIVGAGPVGLFAVFEAGMLKLSCHVVDALPALGGQCSALYPEKPIYDIPGHPSILAQELIDKLAQQAAPFAPVYHLGQRVEKIERIENRESGQNDSSRFPIPDSRFRLTTSTGTIIEAGAIIIAAGCGAFGPNRPPLADIEKYEGSGVHYMVARREDFRDKRLVIAGGGDSAIDWTVSLAELASKIYVVHRRPKFRAAPDMVARMEALAASGKVELVVPYQLDALEGESGRLSGVVVKTLEGEARTLPADHLLAFFGLSMELGPIAEWGVNLHANHIEVQQQTCATSRPGIFAVGDIAHYPGKLKLILSGFAEAASAVHAARAHIHPGEAFHFEYSTTTGVPGT